MRQIIPIPLSSLLFIASITNPSNAHQPPNTPQNWTYTIPPTAQDGPSQARFHVPTPNQTLPTDSLLALEKLQVSSITKSTFDWWYFDAVSDTDPRESLVVTFFAAPTTAFPFINSTDSVLIAYIWATFANGSIFAEYQPATLATVSGGQSAKSPSAGTWDSTGFSWEAVEDDLSRYEVVIGSMEMGVHGRFVLSSRAAPHLPCGLQPEVSTLEVAPRIGWANPIPDGIGSVDLDIQGTRLKFQGPAYHDKNWSDRPFAQSVNTWYWGHGRLGSYSIVWFSYIGLDEADTTYVSGYVARGGETLVSACDYSVVRVRPTGAGARYPPRRGDIPDGFHLVFDLGEESACLRLNVLAQTFIGGDGDFYLRWTGTMTGEVVERPPGDVCMGEESFEGKYLNHRESLQGVAVFEQFAMLE